MLLSGFAILSVGFIVLSFIAKLVIVQRLQPNDNQLESHCLHSLIKHKKTILSEYATPKSAFNERAF
jgi:hypothetical protein